MHENAVRWKVEVERHANYLTAHAHIHHPDKHTALDIAYCHFESSLHQGASVNPPAARTAFEQCRVRAVLKTCIHHIETLVAVQSITECFDR